NSHQRKSGKDLARRVANLFSFASYRKPVERMGVASKRGARWPACTRCAHGGDDRALRRQANSIATALGRLPTQAKQNGILAGPSQPFARPVPVHATGGWQLADRTAGTVKMKDDECLMTKE